MAARIARKHRTHFYRLMRQNGVEIPGGRVIVRRNNRTMLIKKRVRRQMFYGGESVG